MANISEHLIWIMKAAWSLPSIMKRLKNLEQKLEFLTENKWNHWLVLNRAERMDALCPFFDEGRRAFHLERYRFTIAKVPGLRVADIACGTGYGAHLMAEGGAKNVEGFDVDPDTVDYANHIYGTRSVSFVCASADGIPRSDATYDMITSFETIEHVPDDRTMLDEFARLLKPGGLLIVSTPNAWPLEIMPHHVREYSLESFRQVLEKNFTVLSTYNQNSGSSWEYNHGQAAGIVPTTDSNAHLAECFLCLCRKN